MNLETPQEPPAVPGGSIAVELGPRPDGSLVARLRASQAPVAIVVEFTGAEAITAGEALIEAGRMVNAGIVPAVLVPPDDPRNGGRHG